MKRYNIKVVFSMDIIAEDASDVLDCINELDYNFLETTGKCYLERFAMADTDIMESQPLTKKELEEIKQYA
ncbi:hypothetical protein EBR03_07955 [bacterium]|nr:hypothetical protein [bacterium]